MFSRIAPFGLFTDGEALWGIGEQGAVEVRRIADGTEWVERAPSQWVQDALTLSVGKENTSDAAGLWFNGVTMFVAGDSPATGNRNRTVGGKIRVYRLGDNASGLVVVSGRATPEGTLTADTSAITDPDGLPDSFAPDLQWQTSIDSGITWTDIAGQTAAAYLVTDDDLGKWLRVQASFTDNGGSAELIFSSAVKVTLPQATQPGLGSPHVAAGGYHTCALLKAGDVECRG